MNIIYLPDSGLMNFIYLPDSAPNKYHLSAGSRSND